MSNKMRWRYGETNSVVATVDSSTVIEIGDLLYLSSGKAIPAKSITAGESTTESQQTFSSGFLGVAMQQSCNGDATPIRVATSGVFEYDCASNTFSLGDKVGLFAETDGSITSNQKIAKVSAVSYAIGRACKTENTTTTTVYVTIKSVIMNGTYA